MMTEYQVTSWRDLPAMVAARDGDDISKVQLAGRLQGAIDEAAMRLGDIGSDDYLAGWRRGPWTQTEGEPAQAAQRIADELAQEWSRERVSEYLNAIAASDSSDE